MPLRPHSAVLWCLLAACEGDDGLDSGLPEGEHLGDLSPDESARLCRATYDYVHAQTSREESRAFLCLLAAIGFGEEDVSLDECEQSYDACVADTTAVEEPAIDCAPEDVVYAPTCEATVGDAQDCLEYVADLQAEVVRTASCSDLKPYEDYVARVTAGDLGEACARANAACTDFTPMF